MISPSHLELLSRRRTSGLTGMPLNVRYTQQPVCGCGKTADWNTIISFVMDEKGKSLKYDGEVDLLNLALISCEGE